MAGKKPRQGWIYIIKAEQLSLEDHPYIFWKGTHLQDEFNYIQGFTVIPLTAQETYKGLPITYPINATKNNNLDKNFYTLIQQICTVDENCFKDADGNWLERIGQLDKVDKEAIEERIKYYLNMQNNPKEDWFIQNASPELLKDVFGNLFI